MRYKIAGLGLFLGVHALAATATLAGTVINSTTGQPAAGDQALLISVVSGRAAVTGRSVTDSGGRYQFTVDGPAESRAVRVIHQGVGYQKPAPAGAKEIDFYVYDAAEKLEGVTAMSYLGRLETANGKLQVIDEITVRNVSDPPRALSNARPFEIQLPAGAELVAGKMKRPGGPPATLKPMSAGHPDQYYFPVPLLPGETRFAIAYQLPYRGEARFEPKISLPLERIKILYPKGMKFEGEVSGMFQPKPEQGGAQVTEAVNPAQAPAFRVWGTGSLAKVRSAPPGAQTPKPAISGGVQMPGPVKPSPLPQFRWFMLAAAALVLAGAAAGFLAHKRKQPRTHPGSAVIAPASSIQ